MAVAMLSGQLFLAARGAPPAATRNFELRTSNFEVSSLLSSRGGQTQAPAWQDVIRNLRHPDAKVRLAAVEQLGNAGYTVAAEAVAPLVMDPDNRVQYAAIDAELTFFLIEPIGGRRILSFNGSTRSRAQEAFDAGPLVRVASDAPAIVIDNLIAAMRDDNPRIRFDAVHAV